MALKKSKKDIFFLILIFFTIFVVITIIMAFINVPKEELNATGFIYDLSDKYLYMVNKIGSYITFNENLVFFNYFLSLSLISILSGVITYFIIRKIKIR